MRVHGRSVGTDRTVSRLYVPMPGHRPRRDIRNEAR
ncbi:hypothetical protein [Achromobacter phage nyashin_LB6]|nr:hypothetical protein [Achromobacter phage nyashin_LB6]